MRLKVARFQVIQQHSAHVGYQVVLYYPFVSLIGARPAIANYIGLQPLVKEFLQGKLARINVCAAVKLVE
jgi:hypothetical protein